MHFTLHEKFALCRRRATDCFGLFQECANLPWETDFGYGVDFKSFGIRFKQFQLALKRCVFYAVDFRDNYEFNMLSHPTDLVPHKWFHMSSYIQKESEYFKATHAYLSQLIASFTNHEIHVEELEQPCEAKRLLEIMDLEYPEAKRLRAVSPLQWDFDLDL